MIYNGRRYVISSWSFRSGHFEPNAVGRDALAWITASDTGKPFEALVDHLGSMYDVDRTTLTNDVRAFLDDCIARDILVNADQEAESREVLREIRSIQKSIPELTIAGFGHLAWLGKEMVPGCQSCTRGKWAVFSVGVACNLSCWFCPYTGGAEKQRLDAKETDSLEEIRFMGLRFSPDELKFQFSLIHDQYNAFAWVGGEPMMPGVLDQTLPLIAYFRETYPSYHQWMYTNGGYATSENMKRLRDAGIRELRFNLAAVDYSPKVIDRMKEARRFFDYLVLEVPMTKRSYEGLLANTGRILDTGLDQMNLAEFIVGKNHFGERLKEEGKLYNYKGFICSPVQSRRYTYDIIRRAVEDRWPVVINDCSNELKYYKLSIQENKRVSIFQGRRGYWNNTYALADIDGHNESLPAV